MDKLKIDLDVSDYCKFLIYLKKALKEKAKEDTGVKKILEISYYLMGLNKEIPKHWEKYLEEFKFKNKLKKDPEYRDEFAEYLRLQAKFKGTSNEK